MKRLWLALLALPLCAQFGEFVATDDGSELYFTSHLRLDDGRPATRPEYRVYRLSPAGVELVAERGALACKYSGSSIDGATRPQISGDGRVVGFTYRDVCADDDPSTMPVQAQAILRGEVLGEGVLELSRNGRWALLSGRNSSSEATLIDLETGEVTTVPAPGSETYAVASDGSVLVRQGIWRAGAIARLPISGAIRLLALSDDARVVVYTRITLNGANAPMPHLMAFDVIAGRETALFDPQSPLDLPYFMGISNDGRRVLYRVSAGSARGPAFVVDTDTGERRPIPLESGELVSDGTLSGSGDFAFLATTSARIVKVFLPAGSSETLVPSTPHAGDSNRFSTGSLVRLRGWLPGTVEDYSGRVLMNGEALPVLFAAGGEVGVQVPWEQHMGDVPMRLDVDSGSPFRQNELITVWPMAPSFEPADPGTKALLGIKFLREDFTVLDSQPRPGDVVRAYMTGLGPVRGEQKTNAPAAENIPIQSDIRCRFLPQGSDAETLFAGLAPGLIGIYRVDFRLPADAEAKPLVGISCQLNGPFGGASFSVVNLNNW